MFVNLHTVIAVLGAAGLASAACKDVSLKHPDNWGLRVHTAPKCAGSNKLWHENFSAKATKGGCKAFPGYIKSLQSFEFTVTAPKKDLYVTLYTTHNCTPTSAISFGPSNNVVGIPAGLHDRTFAPHMSEAKGFTIGR
ncbi:hypothetical protein BJ138DRAFT_548476 [Hygrophoropsis aurantiaca]|uniref:Uncharacterized protein n=1 Tax=Hygrophoropsis aurantiaca TaxID=72124 RepID=A0ACB8ALA2_9AGAM|nr:hypothetical protein BJ138DRAFT_548476 [Hygrophoropsis aurantiaca]